jgi:ferredoxin-nitrite reductase
MADIESSPEEGSIWLPLGEAKAFAPGSVKKLEAGGHALAVGCSSAGPFAMQNACAHEGGSLGEGSLDGDQLTCPLHALKYKTGTGECQMDSRYCQKRYEVKVEGGQLLALLPQAAPKSDPATTKSSVELWKSEKHGLDGWGDILGYAKAGTPMKELSVPQMERMKWFGFFYRKTNDFDRYMTRIRIPGCAMTAAQMKAMAFIAYESGYSILDVTTRGNIQIQGLSIAKLPGVAAALEAVGLTAKQSGHDNVRNITSLPMAGLDPEELIDTRLLAEAMQAMIIDNKEFSDLPRKMNPAFCGRESAAAHVWTQDLSFVAGRMSDGTAAFRLLLGGTQGQSPTLAWCAPVWVKQEEVLTVTAAVLRAYRALGWRHNRHEVRLHFLMERIGNESFLGKVEEELGYSLTPCELPIPKAEREEVFVGWQAQKSPQAQAGSWQAHHWALGVCVPVGRLTWEQAKGLADLAETYGDSGIRSTLDQNLIITGIPHAMKTDAEHALAALGLSHESDSITRQVVACTGKQFCNLAIGETKGHAFWMIEELRRRRVQLHGITVHMSGCPNSCGMTLTADIGLQGTKARRNNKVVDAFDVYLGGGAASAVQLGILFKKAVPVDEMPHFLQGKIAEYHKQRSKGEGFSQFWRERLKDHVAVPADAPEAWWLCTKCGYPHAGDVPPTYCPTCSAIRSKFDPAPDEFDAVAYRKGLTPKTTSVGAGSPRPALAPVAKPAAKRLVIVGGGIAAYTAAAEARRLDPNASITLLSEEAQGFYNRLNLTRFLNQEIQKPALFDFGVDWLKRHKVDLHTGARVTGLQPLTKDLQLADGETVGYDACILAHGAAPAFPVFWREGLEGLLALRTLAHAEALVARATPGSSVVVVGGGVLGLEAACGLAKAGAKVTIVEIQDRLMPRQLDVEAAGRLRKQLENLGLQFRLGGGVRELRGLDKVEALVLSDGTVLKADTVMVSAGIQPQVSWAKAAGLACARGIEVDDSMASSAEGVWACGDVAQWRGQVPGLWAVAQEQALVAAAAALGKPAAYQGAVVLTQLKCAGVDCISMGDTSDLSAGGPVLSENGQYRRLFTRNGLPVGAILYGTSQGLGDWKKLVEDGLALERLTRRVLPTERSLAGLVGA